MLRLQSSQRCAWPAVRLRLWLSRSGPKYRPQSGRLQVLQSVQRPLRYSRSAPRIVTVALRQRASTAADSCSIPTGQLWNTAGTVPYHELQVGDLLFFRFDGKMSHVGIYVGDEKFVHAPSSGRRVTVDSLNATYYRSALMRAARLY